MSDSPAPRPRRHDLDWLRVLAITALIFFHAAMPFVAEWGWHLKNAQTSNLLLEVNHFLHGWRMPLLFLISGVGTAYALGRRSPARYLRERGRRLLLPLVFGSLVVVPPQIYMERLAQGVPFGSYLDFYRTVFTLRVYPAGNLSWHHLWFVAYLFLYSVALLPLFAWLRGERRRRATAVLASLVDRAGLWVLALPLALPLALLRPSFPGPQDVVHDWAMLLHYLIWFLYGFLLSDADELWARIEERRGTSLRWAVLGLLAVNYLRWNDLEPAMRVSSAYSLYSTLAAVTAWHWVLTVLGYAKRYLSFSNPVLRYANEGIYPIYILHQTVTVVLAFYVLPLQEDLFAKFLFLAACTLALSWALYEVLVRPFAVTRLLFGLRPLARGAASPAPRPAAPPDHPRTGAATSRSSAVSAPMSNGFPRKASA
ncbi:MAG TPA: acyltransferase family protein [Gemmatimonadaceae bacterium]|nr:acyltransferase family protein [Gemmatimonadaceae bacterium]